MAKRELAKRESTHVDSADLIDEGASMPLFLLIMN